MTYSKTGNKKERKPVPANDSPRQGECRSGLPHFFVMSRLTASFATGTMTVGKPSFETKVPFRGSVSHAEREWGSAVLVSRKGSPTPLCPQKGVQTFVDGNGAFSACFPAFWKPPPMTTKPNVLLDTLVCYKLNEIGRLALQQSA